MAKQSVSGSTKVVKMRSRQLNGDRRNGAKWSDQRLQQWATRKEGEPAFMYELKRMLLRMIREGKVKPDGTDRQGNPTFSFKQH
jgi:hypothetical protein